MIIESSLDGFWSIDLASGEIWYSGRYRELLGYREDASPEALDPFGDNLHPEDRGRVRLAFEQHLQRNQPFEIEYRMRTRWGGYRWFRSRALARHDGSGKGTQIFGSVRDISKRKQVIRDLHDRTSSLERSRVQAERASRTKSEFLATMSHEIRTPLNAVLGMVNLLLSTELTAEQRNYTETLEASGRVLLSLVNDILDLSKLEVGKIRLQSVDFELSAVVRDVIAVIIPVAGGNQVPVHGKIAPELPRAFRGDSDRIKQILLNLVGNAVKFTDVGRVEVRVRPLRRDGATATVRFEVVDTGIGIRKELHSAIFNRFTQIDSSSIRTTGGTGLGLAICRQLVELMGGRIGVDSEPGRGSTFWFELPLTVIDAGTLRRTAPRAAAGADGSRNARPLHVLVAEDNAVNQMYIAKLLGTAGHTVEIVGDGAAAIEAVRGGAFDVVLMDAHMPVMDGLDATKGIRALPGGKARIPIIALTANAMAEHRDLYLSAGMDGYVAKPIDVDALAAAMAETTGAAVHLHNPVRGIDAARREPELSAEARRAMDALFERIEDIDGGNG